MLSVCKACLRKSCGVYVLILHSAINSGYSLLTNPKRRLTHLDAYVIPLEPQTLIFFPAPRFTNFLQMSSVGHLQTGSPCKFNTHTFFFGQVIFSQTSSTK